MADHLFRLVQGATAVNLSGGPRHVLSVDLGTPQVTAEEVASYLEDGGDVEAATYANVDLSAELLVTGANGGEVQANLNAVEALLRAARDRQRDLAAEPVYFEVQLEGTGDVDRSEVLHGAAGLPGGALHIPWLARKVTVPLQLRRRFYWEKNAAVELALVNAHGNGTGGVTVYNHNDGAHDSYVAISGAGVVGVLPAPLKLSLENTTNDVPTTYRVWAGQFVSFGATIPNPTIEAEGMSGGTPAADATCSNGQYTSVAVTSTWARALRATLGQTNFPTDRRRYALVLARFRGDPTGINLDARLSFPVGAASPEEIARTEPIVCTGNRLQMLGPLQLPPWLTRVGPGYTLASLYLDLWGYHATGATLELDYLYLLPLDGWRIYTPSSRGLLYADVLHDNAPVSRQVETQHVTGISGYSGLYLPQGPGLYAWPGRDTQLHFLHNTDGGAAPIERTTRVRAYYFPRRLTL